MPHVFLEKYSPELDFVALQQAATYDGYSAASDVVIWLWRIIHSMTCEQQKQFLHFVTGSDRVPIKGLSKLTMVVQRNGPDANRLPTALTCFSRLLLPEYVSESKLRTQLFLAMEHGKGFGLV